MHQKILMTFIKLLLIRYLINMNMSNLYWINNIFDNINFKILPHGIIINGPRGIGKEILAKKIASSLILGSDNFISSDLDNHPDFFLLKKDKILIKHITLRQNNDTNDFDEELGYRNINQFLSLTSSASKNKVAVILNAESMNNQSQNALLKSLEEPANNTYIILTVNRRNSLLDTIYSRCQLITVPTINQEDINKWLVQNGVSEFNAKDFPSYITPLKILDEIKNNQHNTFKDFINILVNFFDNKESQEESIKKIDDLDLDLITKTNYLIEFLKILLKSKILSEKLSGVYIKLNSSTYNKLKISNLINELNELRYDYFRVPQINQKHVINYFLNELKNSIRI